MNAETDQVVGEAPGQIEQGMVQQRKAQHHHGRQQHREADPRLRGLVMGLLVLLLERRPKSQPREPLLESVGNSGIGVMREAGGRHSSGLSGASGSVAILRRIKCVEA